MDTHVIFGKSQLNAPTAPLPAAPTTSTRHDLDLDLDLDQPSSSSRLTKEASCSGLLIDPLHPDHTSPGRKGKGGETSAYIVRLDTLVNLNFSKFSNLIC